MQLSGFKNAAVHVFLKDTLCNSSLPFSTRASSTHIWIFILSPALLDSHLWKKSVLQTIFIQCNLSEPLESSVSTCLLVSSFHQHLAGSQPLYEDRVFISHRLLHLPSRAWGFEMVQVKLDPSSLWHSSGSGISLVRCVRKEWGGWSVLMATESAVLGGMGNRSYQSHQMMHLQHLTVRFTQNPRLTQRQPSWYYVSKRESVLQALPPAAVTVQSLLNTVNISHIFI